MYESDDTYEEILELARAGKRVIVVHEQSSHAKHYGHLQVTEDASDHTGWVFETGMLGAGIMGRRADVIYISKKAFTRMALAPHTITSSFQRENSWLACSLMCRLVPGGRIVIV